ncbi:MAG: hypothetical protein V4864_08835 [Pseudomonadota bacterium]
MRCPRWTAAPVLAALCAAPAWPGGAGAPEAAVATAQAPARHCTAHPAATLRALRQGRQRLVLVLRAFQPPTAGSGALNISLLAADGQRHQLAQVTVHPLRAFSAREAARAQRFLLPAGDAMPLPEAGQPLCIEVGFASADAAGGAGAAAEFTIETIPAPGAGNR